MRDDKPFDNYELQEIYNRVGKWCKEIIFKKEIESGKSGASVWLVDILLSENELRNHLLDAFQSEIQSPSDFNDLCFRLEYKAQPRENDTLRDDIRGLLEDTFRRGFRRLQEVVRVFSNTKPSYAATFDLSYIGPHYLKIHRDNSNMQQLNDYVQLMDDKSIGSNIPRLSRFFEYNKRILAFYRPAHDSIDPQKVMTLKDVYHKQFGQIHKAIDGLTAWLERFSHMDSNPGSHPLEVLKRSLGQRRIEGTESIQARTLHRLKQMNFDDHPERIQDARCILWDSILLPNPIGYLLNDDYWGDVANNLVVPLGKAHGDLHSSNIICQIPIETRRPDIIDFGDYRADQIIFFDMLYLEFDIILQFCSPRDETNRKDLLSYICETLMGDAEKLIITHQGGSPRTLSLEKLLVPLRDTAQNIVDGAASSDDYRIAFWLAAVSVGLNFARKKMLEDAERLFALIYAGAALRHVLAYIGIDFKNCNQQIFNLPWLNMSVRDEVPLQDVFSELERYIRLNNNVLIVISPEIDSLNEASLITDLVEHIAWFSGQKPQVETLAETMEIYRTTAGNLNLREAIRHQIRHLHRNDLNANPLNKSLSKLGTPYRNIHIGLFDWDETLEQRLYYAQPYKWQESQVHRLCGHPEEPSTLCHVTNLLHLTADSPIYEIYANFERRLRDSHVVFLGRFNFNQAPYNHWLDILAQQNRLADLQAWYLAPDRENLSANKSKQLKFARVENAIDFLQKLEERFNKATTQPLPDFDTVTWKISWEEYQPVSINHDRLIKSILTSPHMEWFIYSPPGTGKSAMLQRLLKEHEKRLETLDYRGRTALSISLADDRALSVKPMSIVQLFYDKFEIPLPKYVPKPDTSEEARLQELTETFLHSIQRRAPNDTVFLFTIDDVEVSIDTTVDKWLQRDFPAIIRNFNGQNIPIKFKLVVSQRLNYRDERKLPDSIRRRWKEYYKFERLDELRENEVLEMLLHLIQNAPIPGFNEHELHAHRNVLIARIQDKNGNFWQEAAEQANSYLSFCHNNMRAVVALMKYHIEQGLLIPNWPKPKANEFNRCKTEVVFKPIQTEISKRIRYHTDKDDRQTRESHVLDLLMCRRLNSEVVANICRQDEMTERNLRQTADPFDEIRTRLFELDKDANIYCVRQLPYNNTYHVTPDDSVLSTLNWLSESHLFFKESEVGLLETWNIVTPSYHYIVRDSFFYQKDAAAYRRFGQVMLRAFETMHRMISDQPNPNVRKGLILDAIYYYYLLYEYDQHWQSQSPQYQPLLPDKAISPEYQLLVYIDRYRERTHSVRLERETYWSELNAANDNSEPSIPKALFENTLMLIKRDEKKLPCNSNT
jgi:hypothetical protein